MQQPTDIPYQSRFGDPITPDPVAFSFDAPGWYLVFGGIVLFLLVYGILKLKEYRENKFRRDALAWLDLTEKNLKGSKSKLVYEANVLMKRLALRIHNRAESASLTGSGWVAYLNEKCASAGFNTEDEKLIQEAVYAQHLEQGVDKIDRHISKVKTWIQKHKID